VERNKLERLHLKILYQADGVFRRKSLNNWDKSMWSTRVS
jgi:hypothetical protein